MSIEPGSCPKYKKKLYVYGVKRGSPGWRRKVWERRQDMLVRRANAGKRVFSFK